MVGVIFGRTDNRIQYTFVSRKIMKNHFLYTCMSFFTREIAQTIFVDALFHLNAVRLENNFHIHQADCILLSRLLYITEGKYWNQLKKFRKFRDVLSSGSHKTGSTAKKVTASESAKPGPHIHIFFLSQGSRVSVEMGTKSKKVCMCVCDAFLLASISSYTSKVHGHFWLKFGMVLSIYGALMLLNFCGDWGLELNFFGFQIEENFWKAKFKIFI